MVKSSPNLIGYNNNLRHQGRTFHLQTEDYGSSRCKVVTQLFSDTGQIVASSSTDYSSFDDGAERSRRVRAVMREQHKAVFIALRGGELDEKIEQLLGPKPVCKTLPPPHTSAVPPQSIRPPTSDMTRESSAQGSSRPSPHYSEPRPAAIFGSSSVALFGGAQSRTSLDDVLLGYLQGDASKSDAGKKG